MKLLNVGFGNMVAAGRIVAVIAPGRLQARDTGHLIDATAGRRTRAVLMMDTDHVVLSAVQPETIAGRMQSEEG